MSKIGTSISSSPLISTIHICPIIPSNILLSTQNFPTSTQISPLLSDTGIIYQLQNWDSTEIVEPKNFDDSWFITNLFMVVTGMATCFHYCPCHLEITRTGSHLNYAKISGNGTRFGFGSGSGYGYRRLKFVVSAELTNAFSVNIGLDSQVKNFLIFFSVEFQGWFIPMFTRLIIIISRIYPFVISIFYNKGSDFSTC